MKKLLKHIVNTIVALLVLALLSFTFWGCLTTFLQKVAEVGLVGTLTRIAVCAGWMILALVVLIAAGGLVGWVNEDEH